MEWHSPLAPLYDMHKIVILFLRLSLSLGFFSAVADRFGLWPENISSWGTWDAFLGYTGSLLPFLESPLLDVTAISATVLELVLGVGLLIAWKLRLMAVLSGILLLAFAVAMLFRAWTSPFASSVFTASAAAFALALLAQERAKSSAEHEA